jgi:hypothetical protein
MRPQPSLVRLPREMVTERHRLVAGFGTPETSGHHGEPGHLILVFRSPGELADLEHVQAEPLDRCEHAV